MATSKRTNRGTREMTTDVSPVDWRQVHEGRYVWEDQCWSTCNGGFCCSNNHPDFAFQLIPTRGTTIVYMEQEYEYLKQQRQVPETQLNLAPPQAVSFDFGGPRPLRLLQTPCRLLGLCDGVIEKPLLCKLYPFLPILDADGELRDVLPASIFELTFDLIAVPTPCTVRAKKELYLSRWRQHAELLSPLKHPYIVLFLQAANQFAKVYADGLRANETLRGREGRDFWIHWELEYLGGRLVDGERLRSMVAASYEQLTDRHGVFLSPGE